MPTELLGDHAEPLKRLIIDVVMERHEAAADAHVRSGSRYGMGFGAQWRDLLDDLAEACRGLGYRSEKLIPAGYRVPVVNGCVVVLWRAPEGAAVEDFGSSQTRRSAFEVAPQGTLFEVGQTRASGDSLGPSLDGIELGALSLAGECGGRMPVILVVVRSTPRQLQSIAWVHASVEADGRPEALSSEQIWQPEDLEIAALGHADAFDSGEPRRPEIEPRELEARSSDE